MALIWAWYSGVMGGGRKQTVFISHASRDRAVAENLCGALEQHGITCWLSSRDIVPGANFQESIVRALRAARVMILVFSGNANNSDEIKKELALASQNGLMIIPVRVADVKPNDAFSYELATRQWVDLFGDWEQAVARLAHHINFALGVDKTPPPAPQLSGTRRGLRFMRGRRGYVAVAAMIGLLLAGGIAWYMLAGRPAPVAAVPAPTVRPGHLIERLKARQPQ